MTDDVHQAKLSPNIISETKVTDIIKYTLTTK